MNAKLLPAIATIAGILTGRTSMHMEATSAEIDHIVLAISDLQRGIGQLGEMCGVMPVAGGTHDDKGTENALLAAGARAYLEVLAPREGAALPPELRPLRAVADLTPVSWAVSIGDADLATEMLRAHGYTVSEPLAGSRQTTDGGIVRWRTLQIVEPKIAGAPFFIEWEVPVVHPATTSPMGCPLLSLELHSPQDEELRRLLGLLNVQGQAIHAATHRLVVTLQGPTGPVRLPAGN